MESFGCPGSHSSPLIMGMLLGRGAMGWGARCGGRARCGCGGVRGAWGTLWGAAACGVRAGCVRDAAGCGGVRDAARRGAAGGCVVRWGSRLRGGWLLALVARSRAVVGAAVWESDLPRIGHPG
ncbi:hypothetical protein GCM10007977_051580 [Dactylosporangium sucinum]|uniref:Uncharacterized protein n=1 Tax=Dactylosporangium sucinum TaxID=1424081 RepID=A0A917WZ72_9ACTN|nr:hypothetical protein GCM10007977_051580 [Dactylosporangium sucinum]